MALGRPPRIPAPLYEDSEASAEGESEYLQSAVSSQDIDSWQDTDSLRGTDLWQDDAHPDTVRSGTEARDISAASPASLRDSDGGFLATCTAGVPPDATQRNCSDPALPPMHGTDTFSEEPGPLKPPIKRPRIEPPDDDLEVALLASILDFSK